MNSIWKGEENFAGEIELTDAELAAIYGADYGDDVAVPQTDEAPEPVEPAQPVRSLRSLKRPARLARTPKVAPVPQEQDSQNVTSEEEGQLIKLLLGLFVNS
jgi:hypothetical protein